MKQYTAADLRAGKVPGLPLRKRKPKAAPALIAPHAARGNYTALIEVPVKLESEANRRGAWYVHDSRRKKQRAATAAVASTIAAPPQGARCDVTIMRIAPRKLDTDNLASSAKAVRDEIAKWMGVSDGPNGPVTWHYDQRAEGKACGVVILVEW